MPVNREIIEMALNNEMTRVMEVGTPLDGWSRKISLTWGLKEGIVCAVE